MRHLDPTWAQSLASGAANLCVCWRFQRRDGAVFGGTDHDRPLSFDGVTYDPDASFGDAQYTHSSGLAPGQAAGAGALSAAFLTDDDLRNGVWNGARVDVFKVDWSNPNDRVQIWSGRLGEIVHSQGAFTAELVSLKADLEASIGRVYGRNCDADVGDARCGVDLTGPVFSGAGVVAEPLSQTRFRASGLTAFADTWFSGGRLVWTSGPNSGGDFRVTAHTFGALGAELEVSRATAEPISAGDTFNVTAGCDKAFATCRAKFANQENFRGFPHLLGNDAVLAGPAADGRNDGGAR